MDEITEDKQQRDLSVVSRGFLSFMIIFCWNCKPLRSGTTQHVISLHKGHGRGGVRGLVAADGGVEYSLKVEVVVDIRVKKGKGAGLL